MSEPDMSHLPSEVILLICEELGNIGDFGSLFNYSLTGKRFAGSALSELYRQHHKSAYFLNDELSDSQNTGMDGATLLKLNMSRWALLWKSIIRSSLGTTLFPYCLYIRSLDFRNLAILLDDMPADTLRPTFFEGDMAVFRTDGASKRTRAGVRHVRLDIDKILELVGESITKFAGDSAVSSHGTAALEEISGQISTRCLIIWCSRLPRLQSMSLFDAGVLNENVGAVIGQNCPDFNDLTFFRCSGDSVDSDMAGFLGALPINSLRSFNAIDAGKIRSQSLVALSSHSLSLKTLKLDGLSTEGLMTLPFLRECKAVEELSLAESTVDNGLGDTKTDTIREIAAWLCQCKNLKNLILTDFMSAPEVLTNLCSCDQISLRSLEVDNYEFNSNQDLHRAISHQKSLESLTLKADPAGGTRDDIDIFIWSLSQLQNLKELDIHETSEFFDTNRIIEIATNLPELESFMFSGYGITDAIWPSINRLKNLRLLTSMALSSFTVDGILRFINDLESNKGLVLAVLCQNQQYDLSSEDRARIRKSIDQVLGGSFVYEIYREAADLDYDSD